MDKKKVSVLGFGDNVVDIYEHTHTMYPGGNCVNFAAYASMFGAERSAYMGYFGDDRAGAFVQEILKDLGIDISRCVTLHGENGYSKVTITCGERIFGDYNQGGIRGKTAFVLSPEDLDYMKTFDLVHSGNYSYMESELSKIKNAGIPVSFDFSDDSDEDYYKMVAPHVTYAFCSHDGDDEAVRAHLRFMKDLGPEIVSASRGAKGCMLYDGQRFYEQGAVPLEKVVDTMGAGDSLLTAFLVGFIAREKAGEERPQAIRGAIAEAAAFAAKICMIDGAFGYGSPYEA